MRYPEAAEQSKLLDALSRALTAFACGRVDEALDTLHHVIDELELDDPRARQPYAVGMVLVMLRNLGERDAAWAWLEHHLPGPNRCELEQTIWPPPLSNFIRERGEGTLGCRRHAQRYQHPRSQPSGPRRAA